MPELVTDLLSQLSDVQQRLNKALQDEYYCDDLSLPPDAFGWDAARIRAYYENGGEEVEVVDTIAPPPSPRAPGRAVILCLGDATTELASHALNADMVKHEKSPPLANEMLVAHDPAAAPIVEAGPGWLLLLSRDYAWRACADVINRGLSGTTTRLAIADADAILAALPASRPEDVVAVTLSFGIADCAVGIPAAEHEANLITLLATYAKALPNAKLIVMSPNPAVDARWREHMSKHGLDGSKLGLGQLKAYAASSASAVKKAGLSDRVSLVDVYHGMMQRLMQFNDALGPTGAHLSAKGNHLVYRMLKEHLSDELKIGPRTLPVWRPPSYAAAYPKDVDGIDAKVAKAGRKK